MAHRGTSKWRSQEQEAMIAVCFNGIASPSSGAASSDSGDVRSKDYLIECKQTGRPDRPAKSISVKLADMEKIADEAWAEGRTPLMALRMHAPGSVLADKQGNVDLIVRRLADGH